MSTKTPKEPLTTAKETPSGASRANGAKGAADEAQMFALLVALVDELQRRVEHPQKCPTCKQKGLTAAMLDVIRKTLRDNNIRMDSARRAGLRGGLAELRAL